MSLPFAARVADFVSSIDLGLAPLRVVQDALCIAGRWARSSYEDILLGQLEPPSAVRPGYERQVLSLGPDLHPQHWLRAFATAVFDRVSTCTFTGFNVGHNSNPGSCAWGREQYGAACHPRIAPVLQAVGQITALEGRIYNQINYRETKGTTYQAVSCDGGPLANTVHDGRWGRISET